MWTSFHTRRFTSPCDDAAAPDADALARGSPSRQHASIDQSLRAMAVSGTGSGPSASAVGPKQIVDLWPLQINGATAAVAVDADTSTPGHRAAMDVDPSAARSESSLSTSSTSVASSSALPSSNIEIPQAGLAFSPSSPVGNLSNYPSPPMTPPDALQSIPHAAERQWNAFPPNETRRMSVPNEGQASVQTQTRGSFTTLDVPKSSSRNSIFSASSPVMQPAPRLPQSVDRTSTSGDSLQSSPSIRPTRKQRNFFSDSVMTPDANLSPIAPASPILNGKIDGRDRPGYGRSSTEERERERERIRQTNTEVDFRLCPSKDFLLGEGRHSDVYLGSFRIVRYNKSSRSQLQDDDLESWTLCAMKRPHADHQSQLLALEEAFALRRLGPHPNIIRLINIRDEVRLKSRAGHASSFDSAQIKSLSSSSSSSTTTASHSRSTSDTHTVDLGAQFTSQRPPLNAAIHRRLASQPERRANGTGAASATSIDSDHLSRSDNQNNGDEAPRLLMLLELLPFSLSTFVRRNPEVVDYEQWRFWAWELAGVVEWMHSRGCIHADLKPENVLLTSDLHVKVCDFNSALFPNPSMPLTDGMGLGTPAFGAPELSRGVQRQGTTLKGFSFPVDVWSLGAILYSLATGVEPFRRARSMIDIVYRKRVFFQSEESDRISRMSVAEGSSTAGLQSRLSVYQANGASSLPASRTGSLRGRKSDGKSISTARASPALHTESLHRRAPSTESVSSAASSAFLTSATSNGRLTSIKAISLLLGGEEVPTGVLTPPEPLSQSNSVRDLLYSNENSPVSKATMRFSQVGPMINGHHRASSLGKTQGEQLRTTALQHATYANDQDEKTTPAMQRHEHQRARGATESEAKIEKNVMRSLRPDMIRRTTSYTGESSSEATTRNENARNQDDDETENTEAYQRHKTNDSSTELRRALAASMVKPHLQGDEKADDRHSARLSRPSSALDASHIMDVESAAEDQAEQKSYKDGSPALILPGGGRLPDEARSLLERMLNVDPDLRPTAAEVRQALEAM